MNTTAQQNRADAPAAPQEVPVDKLLPQAIVAGARVRSTLSPRLEGVVTRVIDRSGARSGIVEVRWDHQKRVSRSAGFQLGDEVVPA